MEIYILRHGVAEEPQTGQPDSERALTPDGRKKLRNVLRTARCGRRCAVADFDQPLQARAADSSARGGDFGVQGRAACAPRRWSRAHRPKAVWDEIRVHKDEARILLAGHEPLFSRLTAYLLGSPNLQVDFKKGAIACIELERFPAEPHGVLRWMLTSKLAGA